MSNSPNTTNKWDLACADPARDVAAMMRSMGESRGLRPQTLLLSPHEYESLTWDHLKPLMPPEKALMREVWRWRERCRDRKIPKSWKRKTRRFLRKWSARAEALEAKVAGYQAAAGPEREERVRAIAAGLPGDLSGVGA